MIRTQNSTFRKTLQTTVTGVVVSLLFSVLGEAPVTETDIDSEALSAIKDVIPEVLTETVNSETAEIGESGEISIADTLPVGGVSAYGVNLLINYVGDEATTVGDGLTEYEGMTDAVDAIVQETAMGIRIMTVIGDVSAPSSYSYTLDVPRGTLLVENEAGFSLESGENLLGTLQKPWAYDAAGNAVPTSYGWADGVLTQYVDLTSASVQFPVIADPAWGYAYKFPVTKTAAANKKLLKKCFSCYFPVKGAPRSFPIQGQLLPLRIAGVFNFECKFKREITGSNYFGFQFDATRNHVDKYGSNIVFQFRNIGGKKYLTVDAYIVNDSFWIKNAPYRGGAIQSWQSFAKNLNKA